MNLILQLIISYVRNLSESITFCVWVCMCLVLFNVPFLFAQSFDKNCTRTNWTKTINPDRTKKKFFSSCQRYNGHISQFSAYVSNWIYSCVISNEFYFDVWIYAWNCMIVIRKYDCGLDSPPRTTTYIWIRTVKIRCNFSIL